MEMSTQEIAEQTMNARPGKDFRGRTLIVNEARPLEEKRPFRSAPSTPPSIQ
jgi:hypothetical protein